MRVGCCISLLYSTTGASFKSIDIGSSNMTSIALPEVTVERAAGHLGLVACGRQLELISYLTDQHCELGIVGRKAL